MINDLDETLRYLLQRDMPVENGQVDIKFEQPNREWATKLVKPTLNLYLYDVRENVDLRDTDWIIGRDEQGRATKRRPPRRVDLSYLITAWSAAVEDEHQLLTRVMAALFQYRAMPEDALQGRLAGQELPLYTRVADPETMPDAFELWSVLDNELKPAVNLVVTLPIDPQITLSGPVVLTKIIEIGRADQPEVLPDTMTQIAGRVLRKGTVEGLSGAAVTVEGTGFAAVTDEAGRFAFSGVPRGEHQLSVQIDGRKSQRRITIPGSNYDVEIEVAAKK